MEGLSIGIIILFVILVIVVNDICTMRAAIHDLEERVAHLETADEHDLGLLAILNGPAAMKEWLEAQDVDLKAAVGGYSSMVGCNVIAERALIRAVVKQIVHGDALHGCEYDGDASHLVHRGCRLDPARAAKAASDVAKEEVA